ncbi:MAG: hypothetical protein Q3M30_12000 [Candidatus Electrothrix sp. Rat3]|nr:hypothetical protein [Candidatus Electrothrix rattekaaiensis]
MSTTKSDNPSKEPAAFVALKRIYSALVAGQFEQNKRATSPISIVIAQTDGTAVLDYRAVPKNVRRLFVPFLTKLTESSTVKQYNFIFILISAWREGA